MNRSKPEHRTLSSSLLDEVRLTDPAGRTWVVHLSRFAPELARTSSDGAGLAFGPRCRGARNERRQHLPSQIPRPPKTRQVSGRTINLARVLAAELFDSFGAPDANSACLL